MTTALSPYITTVTYRQQFQVCQYLIKDQIKGKSSLIETGSMLPSIIERTYLMGWKQFVKSLTGETISKISQAGHDFRDHSGARSGGDTSLFKSPPSWAKGSTKSGISLFPKKKN